MATDKIIKFQGKMLSENSESAIGFSYDEMQNAKRTIR